MSVLADIHRTTWFKELEVIHTFFFVLEVVVVVGGAIIAAYAIYSKKGSA